MSGLGRHTVDAPVGLAVVVADGDADPAMIGDDDRDDGYGDGLTMMMMMLMMVNLP